MKKRLISILLTVLMVMSMFTGLSVSAYADDSTDSAKKNYVEYTLVEGDYVLRICQKMGINYYTCKEAIMALNNITSENGFRYLSIGEVVKIPVSDAAAIAIMKGDTTSTDSNSGSTGGTASGSNVSGATIAYYLIPYTMQRGETVLGVCNSLGISFTDYADQIMKINGISNWKSVKAGDTILLPSKKVPAVGTTCYAVVAHKVASGDTAYTLCSKYGVNYGSSTKLLQALNNTSNLAAIKAGKNFYLPVATTIKAQSNSSTNTGTNNNNNSNNSSNNSNTGNNNSGNASTAKSYELTANINVTYGTMKFYVDSKAVDTAKEGDVVTVDVTTKDGRAVDSLVVKFADGRADVKLEANSFIMPACNVRVDANIKSGYNIKINSNYSFKTVAQVGGINVSSAAAGSSVKIASTDPGFVVKEVEAYYSTMFGLKKEVLSVNDQFCFTMPNKDVTVDVVMAPVETYSFFRADPDHGSFDLQLDGNSVSKAAKGSKVTVVWQAMAGWDISEINVYKADKNGNYKDTDKINVFNNSFTMPGCPVYVEVKFMCTTNFIDIAAVEGGKLIAMVNGVEANEAETNEPVVIVGEAHNKAAGYISEIKELVVTRKADGHRVAVTANTDGSYSFKMPAGGVDISGALKSEEIYSVTVKFNASGSENKVTLKSADKNFSVTDIDTGDNTHTVFAVGTEISLHTLARDTHAFTKFEVYIDGVNFDQEMTDMANEQGLLIMPAKNVTLKAYFSADEIAISPAKIKGKGVVSYMVSADGKTGFQSANSCKIGDFVRVVAQPTNPIYTVTKDSITVVSNKTGKQLTLSDDFCFQMPEGGVTVNVKFVGEDHVAYLQVIDSTAGVADPNHLQGQSMIEARIYDGPTPIVDNCTPYTAIDVKAGEAIVLYRTAASKSKYVIEKIEVLSWKTGSTYEGGLEYVEDGKYRVWVEEDDLSIKVYLKEKTSKTIALNNLTWNTKVADVDCTVGATTNPVVTSCQVGDVVYVIPRIINEAYSFDENSLSITRKSDDGKFTLAAAQSGNDISNGNIYPVYVDGALKGWKYKMPEGGVTGRVEFKKLEYAINLEVSDTDGNDLLADGYVAINAAGNDLQYNVSGLFENIAYKSKVKVALSNAGALEYKIKSVAVEGVKVTDNSFTMPANPVTIQVVLQKKVAEPTTVKLTTAGATNGNVQYYLDKECTKLITDNKAAVNSYVYVKLEPKTGYVIKEGTPTAKNDYDKTAVNLTNEAEGVWSFKTGENNITVTASFVKESYEMTVWVGGASNTDVKVTVEKTGVTSIVKSGDKITVPYNTKVSFAVADTGKYILDTANTSASAGTLKDLSKTGAYIKMPAEDISVTLTLLAK